MSSTLFRIWSCFRDFLTAAAAIVLLHACFISPAYAADPIDTLRRQAENLVSVSSDFVQETNIPMFAQPMRSKGRFAFRRPDALVWEYTDPMREGFVLRGDTGFRWDDGRASRVPFSADKDPVAAIIARQLVAWITFDTNRIGGEYRIETISRQPLCLKMTPLREDVRGVIDHISITFTPEGPASLVELRERQGGRTTITFSNTVVNGPLDDREFE